MRLKPFAIALLLASAPTLARAQASMGQNEVHTSLSANATAAPQTGAYFSTPNALNTITWNVSYASAPASVTVLFETSNDNSVWVTADTSTATTGESRTIFTAARFVRTTESARSGGGAITTTLVGKASPVMNTSLSPASNIIVASIALGTNPAQAGVLRLPNNSYWTGRNAANTADVNGMRIGTSGNIEAGAQLDGAVITGTTITGSSLVTGTNGVSTGAAGFFSVTARGFFDASIGVNIWALNNAAATAKWVLPVTAPTVASGFCTSPTITNGTSVLFAMAVGSACAASSGILNMNATAPNGWHCTVVNLTNNATEYTVQSATSTTQVTLQNYVRTTGVAGNWTAADSLSVQCSGR